MADFRNSGTDTVVKIVLVFFISLLSFSIGTFVGKKFSDNQHKMVAMEPSKAAPEEAAEENKHEEKSAKHESESSVPAHEVEALADDQIAELEQEMASTEELASTSEKPEASEASIAEAPAVKHTEKPAEKIVNHKQSEKETTKTNNQHQEKVAEKVPEKPVEKVVEKPTPAAPIAASPSIKTLAKEISSKGLGKFTIQIASYPSLDEAEKKVQELRTLKFESFATEANIKGRSWYRVNVGMFATVKEAQEHKHLLSERAKVSTAIIQKITK